MSDESFHGTLVVSDNHYSVQYKPTRQGGMIFASKDLFKDWISEKEGRLLLSNGHSIPVSFEGCSKRGNSISFQLL